MITNTVRAILSTLALVALASACESVEQDDFFSRDGISPDPTAILEGSIVYTGPAPTCLYENGTPKQVIGNVVLSLYDYDNSPYPEGQALTAVNLLVVLGDRLFDVSDCLPEGAPMDPSKVISRSASFVWPRLTLSMTGPSNYQMRGFFDYDDDFNPLFAATRGTTAGDVIGVARDNLTNSDQGLLRITLPPMLEAPNGLVHRGTTIVLDRPIFTERPAFRLGDDRTLDADAPFPLAEDAEPDATMRRLRALTCPEPTRDDGISCGFAIERLPRSDAPHLAASGVSLAQDDNRAYAFYYDEVDLTTLIDNAVDRARPDGQIDPHPVLGPIIGLDWYAPIVTLTRRRNNSLEEQAGIPNVRLLGSVMIQDTPPVPGTAVTGRLPLVVPPVALVEWLAGSTTCRVPYFAPKTPKAVAEGRLAHCGDLPTGNYDVNVFAGAAGALPGAAGAQPSYQQWTLPNELGNPQQVGADHVIASQGVESTFRIVDPPAEPARTSCEVQTGNVCVGSTLSISESDLGRGLDSVSCVPRDCCDAIAHLCNVPLCPREPFDASVPNGPWRLGNNLTGPATLAPADASGKRVPDCIPFEMPRQCCSVGARNAATKG